MKKIITTILVSLIAIFGLNLQAQNVISDSDEVLSDSLSINENEAKTGNRKDESPKLDSLAIYGWKVTPSLGERYIVARDTNFLNFHQSTLADGRDVAVGYLGNIGAPAQSKIFFNRPASQSFLFLDAFDYWYKEPQENTFLNAKVPYSNIFYQKAGGDETSEERLMVELSSNFGKKVNVGVNFDYLYARGYYKSSHNKQFTYDIYGSYIGDKYKMHAYFSNNYYNNAENGGIDSTIYITNPDEAKKLNTGFRGESLDIPVAFDQTWNKLQGRRLFVTNRYDLGNDSEEVWVNDSTKSWQKKENYIPLASLIFTTNYTDQRRNFTSKSSELDPFFGYYENGMEVYDPAYQDGVHDFMSYYSFKNTFAFAINEGFRKWTKFGLTAFAEYDVIQYSKPFYSVRNLGTNPKTQIHRSNDAFTIGATLTKEQGKYLKYRAVASKNMLGDDYLLEGDVITNIFVKDREMSVKAKAHLKNIAASYFQKNFSSKFWEWSRDLDATRSVFAGGEIDIPFLNTTLGGGVENIQNHIYFSDLKRGDVLQHSGSVQVVSFRAEHKLKLGVFHWDNQVVYQQTSKEDIIPLPKLSIYSNAYIQTKVAKVLDLQLGVDARYHTKYYTPGYNPLTMQFYNQEDFQIGGFPIATAYVNLNLKYTRFFVMVYNIGEGMGNSNYYSLYRYAVNPLIFKFGLSWKFNN